MPELRLTISEQQEAKIRDLIDSRQSFRISGGTVPDSDGKQVFLKAIEFTFTDQDYFVKKKGVVSVDRESGDSLEIDHK